MIYLTGASGYLGQHIMRLGGPEIVPVPRDQYDMVKGQCVIHAGWPMPPADQADGPASVRRMILAEPRWLVLVSTMAVEEAGEYARAKALAEFFVWHNRAGDAMVIRFPGLYGPPRRSGLMYHATRAMLLGEPFQSHDVPPDWTGMRVEQAAQFCLDLARAEQPGLTIARDKEFEEWLTFCRS
jgi:nucleoside-diphosphate-sugar epimerase